MHINRYITILKGLLAFFAFLAFPAHAQNNIEVTYKIDEGQKTIFTDKVSFVRHGDAERYAWKPSSSEASNYHQQGRAYDIRNVMSIRRYVEHTSTIKLPKNSPINLSDVVVLGDEDVLSVNSKGQYKTSSDYVDAYTTDGKLVFSCWASADSIARVSPADLNATETAIALVLRMLPIVDEQTSDRDFQHLKDMLRKLDAVQKLATAIDASIVKYGYLNYDHISSKFDLACQKVLNILGLGSYTLPQQVSGMAHMPVTPAGREYYGKGMRISIDESEWVHSSLLGKNVWRTKLTAGNYNRFGYSSVMRGNIGNDGKVTLYEEDWSDHLRYIVKPQRVTSSFFDHIEFWKIENWEKIEEFYDQCLIHPVAFSEMTWDEEKTKGISFDFEDPNDVVIVKGSLDDYAMLVYNVFQYVAKPILKKIQKKLKKEVLDIYMYNAMDISHFFIEKMVLDAGFMSKIAIAMTDTQLSKSEKISKVSDIVLEKFEEYLFQSTETMVQAGIEATIWQAFDKAFLNRLKDEFGSAFVYVERIKKYGDQILGLLGIFEYGAAYDIDLDFNDPGLGIPDVPGYDM